MNTYAQYPTCSLCWIPPKKYSILAKILENTSKDMLYGPGFFVMVCKNANIKPLSFQVLVANVSSVDEFYNMGRR